MLDRIRRHLVKRGAGVDLAALPLDDAGAYEIMAAGQTVGLFQLESQGMRDTLRKLRPSSLEEITALISLYRPGPMDSIPEYVECKSGRKPVNVYHPLLQPVLGDTYGVIVYQEQVMKIAQIMGGYSLGEADLLRRAMGKKKKEEMDQQRVRFVSGALERGFEESLAGLLFELMAKFAGYGFNKSHAAPYALIGYQTAWFKANCPVEFFAGSMSLDLSNTDKLAVFYQDARRFNVPVAPPDVNRSGADFEVEDGQVLYALGAVRNVGFEAMRHVAAVREEGGPFADLFDFVERVDPKSVNRRAIENLARAGAFDSIHPNRAQIIAAADQLSAYGQSVSAERISSQANLFGGDAAAARPRLPKVEPWPLAEQLDQELAAVGFYLSGHPLEDMVDVLRRKRVTLYADALGLAEGGTEAFRMAGVVRRKQERASAKNGEKFAFITLSDPTGEFEVLFPPESLRRCREVLEPGQSICIKVRAKANDGEVRFYGDDAEPIERTLEGAVAGMRIYLSPLSTEMDALKRRLETASSGRGGEVTLIAGMDGGREVELRLPGKFNLDAALRGALKTAPGVMFLEDV